MRSRLHSVWMIYNKCLNNRPLLTKSITSGCIALSADAICQLSFPSIKYNHNDDDAIGSSDDTNSRSDSSNDNHQVDKNTKVVDINKDDKDDKDVKNKMNKELVVISYESFNWRRLINFTTIGTMLVGPSLHYWYGFLVSIIPGKTPLSVLYRVILDQFVFSPFMIIPAIYAFGLLLDGKIHNIYNKLQEQWFNTVIANLSVWIPVQLLNFRYILPQYQVLFSNVIGLFWNIYISKSLSSSNSSRSNSNNNNSSNSSSNNSNNDDYDDNSDSSRNNDDSNYIDSSEGKTD